jgi:hypothetical protein
MMITQQIYKYNGALSGITKGVGNWWDIIYLVDILVKI